VDIRADIYGLGGTLFWCLTGRPPFEWKDSLVQQLTSRLTSPPPSVRAWRPELAPTLDALVARMMAVQPEDRYQTPQAVMRALLPFFQPELREHLLLAQGAAEGAPGACGDAPPEPARAPRILCVDDEPSIRMFCRFALQADGLTCDEVGGGEEALEVLQQKAYDLVLLDVLMKGMGGPEVCRRLREQPPCPHLKIIMCSGKASGDEMAQIMLAGADDYLSKPLSITQLRARVKAALRLKEAQDRSDLMTRQLLTVNHELERNLNTRDSDLVHARNALVLALAKLVSYRDSETGAHLVRLQKFTRCLAEEAAASPNFAAQITPTYLEMLECCAPLHDIGKVGLPDHILMKPGRLDGDERVIMQTHTVIGSDTLRAVANHHGFALAFLQMAGDIARHHHERFDGRGYPDRLAGSDIPLAARLVAIADVYDALRSRRVYKPALSHAAALQMMTEGCQGQFDPALVQVFLRCAPRFEAIFREVGD
jgi:response regulator RpfG family c-di-GMP phosphodiesterase